MSCEDDDNELIKSSPDSNLGKLSADLLSQDFELQELKKELCDVNKAFDSFKLDYSGLLTQYNETNDDLQALLHERSKEETGPRIVPEMESMSEYLVARERCKDLEIEKDKYREMYLAAIEPVTAEPRPRATQECRDTEELSTQIRDMSEKIQELELSRENLASRLNYHAAEKEAFLDEINLLRRNLEELETGNMENENEAQLYKEQVLIKNTVLEKLRNEYTELGDENTRLRAQALNAHESKENHHLLLNSANLNQEDIVKDFEALQYRCSETEKREQEALLYIKDCLKLVEQTQLEKEQLVIQAAQSENMRLEVEGSLGSLVEEASKRTLEEVELIRAESNKNITSLISECGGYQERVAELEAELEEIKRCRRVGNGERTSETVLLADKDAIIYKLREHLNKMEDDKAGLTDQLLEVSNTLRASKEHYGSKIKSLQYHLLSSKDKLSRIASEKQSLVNHVTDSKNELELLEDCQKCLRSKVVELQSLASAGDKQHSIKMKELKEEEEHKREDLRRTSSKLVDNLRRTVIEKQKEVNRLQEQFTQSEYLAQSKQMELGANFITLSNRVKSENKLLRRTQAELEKLRSDHVLAKEKAFTAETRLKAIDVQLTSANKQVADVTETETRLCSKIKEMQLTIDQLTLELDRSKSTGVAGVLNHSGLGNFTRQAVPANQSNRDKGKSDRKRDKREKKEKEEINRIFSSDIIRSAKRDRVRQGASTPQTDKSEATIKFLEDDYQLDISNINE